VLPLAHEFREQIPAEDVEVSADDAAVGTSPTGTAEAVPALVSNEVNDITHSVATTRVVRDFLRTML